MEKNQEKKEKLPSFMNKAIVIGISAGVLFGILSYIAYVLNLSEIRANLILEPWTFGEWKHHIIGHIIGIILLAIISIPVALIYYALLRKFESMWVGAAYGVILWGFVFFLLNPIFPNLKEITDLSKDTIITSFCFYLLYGIFIGYSISYEESELRRIGASS